MKTFQLLCTLAGVLLFAGEARAQDVIKYDGSQGLDTRWEWALETAGDVQGPSGFWVGYSFPRMMCENCYSGTIHNSDWNDIPTLEEMLSGKRIDEDFRSVREAARRTLQDLEGEGRMVPKEMAVLFEFKRNGRLPSDVDMSSMTLSFDPGTRPIIWLGSATNTESITLLRSVYSSSADLDARKGSVWGIGMHDAPDLAVPFLSDVLSSEVSAELRKSAAYGLGNQDVERSLNVLRTTALSDADAEVSKAAVYALGNMELAEATKALTDLIERRGLSIEIRKAALYSLGNRDERSALATLRGVALGNHPDELQKAATYAIGNIDLDGAENALADILEKAPRLEVQKAALYAIGNLDTPEGPVFLKEAAINSESDELAKAAVYALSNALEDNDISLLSDVLNESKRTDIRKAAVYAMGNFDGPAAVEALKYVLENETSRDVRKAAVHALGNMDSDEARQVLIALIGDLG